VAAAWIVAERATPNADPKDEAVLYSPAVAPTSSAGTLDMAASVEGVGSRSPNLIVTRIAPR